MMKKHNFAHYALDYPRLFVTTLTLISLVLAAFIVKVHVDTDPENMLAADEPVRIFHNQVKKEFTLHDVVVLGVVNEEHPDGVFNVETLQHVHALTEFARSLKSEDNPEHFVISKDLIAPGNVETILQAGLGQVRFEWLMKEPPQSQEEALSIRDKAMSNPLLKGTLVSEDAKAIGIYIPVSSKDFAATVRDRLLEKIATLSENGDQYHITGLPVAEDTFGRDMFIQMAISAPLAMVAIFLLMLLFFRKLQLVMAPMIIAMLTVLSTMGLLIGTGNTLHIMSSMIPIFLMPIAVVDSIHILSEFFDTYPTFQDRRKTISHVLKQLFMPMLYTSLTSTAGFASLALTPIPPVQIFGIFVAIGILLAWVFTILFVPAYVMLLKESSLAGYGHQADNPAEDSALHRFLLKMGRLTTTRAKTILALTMVCIVIAGYGISRIQINDNPIKWFTKSHPIRIADRILNKHFGGTYEAFLILQGKEQDQSIDELGQNILTAFKDYAEEHDFAGKALPAAANDLLKNAQAKSTTRADFFATLEKDFSSQLDQASDAAYDTWADLLDIIDREKNADQIFKRPEVLRYISDLQDHLNKSGFVGKSNSVADVVQKVHQELFESDPAYHRIPDSINAVAQCLISFQNSHKPDDLWHFVTPDYKKANLWVQLKNGDNQVMESVVADLEHYLQDNPPPVALAHNWAGLTYLNVVWQDKMVSGMLNSFLGSFLIVFAMMAFLFRSPIWGLLAMIPLTVTIALIYGIIGIIGKDYDMPVAVLSSLTLGLAVDFAIHFLERTRSLYKEKKSWAAVADEMFEEPARAIARNVIVIAVGFTPLLAAPLVPYKTVGVFLASIMAVSGIATMCILPAAITVLQNRLFSKLK